MFALANSVDLTPERHIKLVGYASPPRVSTGIRSRLESNAVIFDLNGGKAIVVSIDALFIGSAFIELVREKLVDPTVELIFLASHTHYGPSLDLSKPKLGETDVEWFQNAAEIVASQLNQLILGSPIAVQASYASAPCELSIFRRRKFLHPKRRPPFVQRSVQMMPNPRKSIPNDLQLLKLSSSDGSPIALIWSWPCHPVEASDRNKINAAFPGAVRAALRSELGSSVPIIFMPGFCGDIRPATIHASAGTAFIDRFKIPTEGEVEAFEAGVSAVALETLASGSPLNLPRNASYGRVELQLSDLLDGADSAMPISHLSCGPFSLTALGAEVCSPYLGHLAFDAAQPVFYTGCADETFGYLPTDVQIAEGGYEVERFKGFFEIAGRWKPDVIRKVILSVRALQDGRRSGSGRLHESVEDLFLSRLIEVDG
ncbi:MAG: hypothetical protein KF874_04765 [Rhizobiaceae bacterium]|nr:hypothetical protein [Rhizobiaceae bacterium]